MSQLTDLREHFKKGKSITALEALTKFGVLSLHRRLSDLRKEGMTINDEWVTTTVTKKRIKRYKRA